MAAGVSWRRQATKKAQQTLGFWLVGSSSGPLARGTSTEACGICDLDKEGARPDGGAAGSAQASHVAIFMQVLFPACGCNAVCCGPGSVADSCAEGSRLLQRFVFGFLRGWN